MSASTSYDFQVAGINGYGGGSTGTYSTTYTISTIASTMAADYLVTSGNTTPVAFGISMRKLFAGYAGPIARIYPAGSLTPFYDAYPVLGGTYIDASAISTWLIANNGGVTTGARIVQYNQAVNWPNGTLLTGGSILPLYASSPSSGVIGSGPAAKNQPLVQYDGTARTQSIGTPLSLGTNYSTYTVVANADASIRVQMGVSAANYIGNINSVYQIENSNLGDSTGTVTTNVLRQMIWNHNAGTVLFYIDAASGATPTTHGTTGSTTFTIDQVGGFSSFYFSGYIAEIVLCSSSTVNNQASYQTSIRNDYGTT